MSERETGVIPKTWPLDPLKCVKHTINNRPTTSVGFGKKSQPPVFVPVQKREVWYPFLKSIDELCYFSAFISVV